MSQVIGSSITADSAAVTSSAVNSGARLDRLPISRFHWRILWLIAGGAMVDAFDIYLAGGVSAGMAKEGFSTMSQNALFISATFIGMMLGAGFAGFIGDRFGRRVSYQINLLIFGVASLTACFAPNIQVLSLLRFVMGVGLGAELVVAAATLGEFVPPSHRGRWAALLSMIIAAGLPLASWTSYMVIPTLGWRYMFAIAGIAALFIWVLRKKMPESPRWLESVGRHQEAEATLGAIEREVAASKGVLPPVSRVQSLRVEHAPFRALFSRKIWPRFLVAATILITINVTVYGFIIWMPSFFVQQGMTVTKSLGFTTMMTAGAIFGPFVAFLLADRIGRTRGIVASAVVLIALGVAFPFMRAEAIIIAIGFALVSSFYFMVSLGQFGFVPELFPTEFRLRGAGVAGMLGRAVAIGTPFATVFLFKRFGVYGVLAAVITFLCVLIISILALRLETNRTSLEDI
ncbi:MAG TPA: MFS transporter [Paraburkholderia sp.]|uniref:MFS transporter n=1 Tax=Paraburkholderia sp. TaxID=1926495 RepID=UPI002CB3526E|nr:MFS transporter [Paraburkholderia sp.]HTR10624.1 MFS transporter [Paraburkholderia sp.]